MKSAHALRAFGTVSTALNPSGRGPVARQLSNHGWRLSSSPNSIGRCMPGPASPRTAHAAANPVHGRDGWPFPAASFLAPAPCPVCRFHPWWSRCRRSGKKLRQERKEFALEVAVTGRLRGQELQAKSQWLPSFFFAVFHGPLAQHARFAAYQFQLDGRFPGKLFHQFSQPL